MDGCRTANVKMQYEPAAEADRLRSRISSVFLQDFQKGLSIVSGPNVTNDAAERGVALIESVNSSITTDEEEKQFLLEIVEEHQRSLPNSNKSNWYNIFRTCNKQSDIKGENA